jgi:arabinogalactan oligomer/maltooligosaccharide transport system permease protein
VLAFIGPTLLGILLFNLYPIAFNTYISFTNRNQYHPNPDCSVGLTGFFEPTCWAMFQEHKSSGIATPFKLKDPIYGNYSDLLGDLFTKPVLIAFGELILCFIPLIIAQQINKRLAVKIDRPISPGVLTIGAILLGVALFFVLDVPAALDVIMKSGDFFVVTFRTILYVIICIPLFFTVGLGLALLLDTPNLPGRTFFRVA